MAEYNKPKRAKEEAVLNQDPPHLTENNKLR